MLLVDAAPHAIQNVFVIVMTHVQWSQVHGSASAPYLNGLLSTAAHAEAYVTPPGSFGQSEPYNIWFEAGDNLGTTADNGPTSDHQTTPTHLTTLLAGAGVSWKAYIEGIPGTSCPLASNTATGYYVFHDPFVFFDDVASRFPYSSSTLMIAASGTPAPVPSNSRRFAAK